MAQTQIYYIGTSKVKQVRSGKEVTGWDWGSKGKWTTLKNPTAKSKTEVKYNKTKKNAHGNKFYGGIGDNQLHWGTRIPHYVSKVIGGVEKPNVEVRYYLRGYTKYTKTSALKKKNKMLKTLYSGKSHPYQYRLQYRDAPKYDATYSGYDETLEASLIFFSKNYYKAGVLTPTRGHMMHPQECTFTYQDIKRNLTVQSNNSDRDNKGSYVLTNVRTNVLVLDLEWQGLSDDEGQDLLDTLSPTVANPFVIVQLRNPETGKVVNKTMFASDRTVTKYPNGRFESISVKLTEV